MLLGVIDTYDKSRISGWVYSPVETYALSLSVNGYPCELMGFKRERSDVSASLGVSSPTGFEFSCPYRNQGDRVVLEIIIEGKRHVLIDGQVPDSWEDPGVGAFLHRISRWREAMASPNALAVVCWDGAHNPIGRAKVLYDVASVDHEVFLFAYINRAFGSELWAPLKTAGVRVITIPYEKREFYHHLLRSLGVQFDRLWLCKNRYQSFELAAVLARDTSQVVLDYDDNEEHFSMSESAKSMPYGRLFISHSKIVSERVAAKSCVSVTLQQEFGGELVRHARTTYEPLPLRHDDGTYRLGFFGTVRTHKRILDLAKAVNVFNYVHGTKVQLVVRGDVQPASLQDSLAQLGVEVSGVFANEDLAAYVEDVDALVTGYPTDPSDVVTKYQISSKLGDGLAYGRPVLVPWSASVADFEGIDGVFLFNYESFSDILLGLIKNRRTYPMPPILTLDHNAQVLRGLLEKARQRPASEVFSSVVVEGLGPAIKRYVLVWKQNDAAVYGRRIDQLARSIKMQDPTADVLVLEFLHETRLKAHRDRASWVSSDSSEILRLQAFKQNGGYRDRFGVRYRSVHHENRPMFLERISALFDQERFSPADTTFILFPLVEPWELLKRYLMGFPVIVDVVDNQMSWAKPEDGPRVVSQYSQLFDVAGKIVFNSQRNFENFAPGLPTGTPTAVVPNWYVTLPGARGALPRQGEVLYSGNLNDRLNWDLLGRLARSFPEARFHLVGNADRAEDRLFKLLSESTNVAYHGPLTEESLEKILPSFSCAIMPHQTDKFSEFMNPLKLMMYRFHGLPCVSTDVPGIDADDLVRVAGTDEEFEALLRSRLTENPKRRKPVTPDLQSILRAYF